MDELYNPENDNIDKILTGEIPAISTVSKGQNDTKKRFTLIVRVFKTLNKYVDISNKETYNFEYK